jgi:hypothetical protein
MAKWFSCNGFAMAANAMRCSIFVPIVTADSAIAAAPAAGELASISTAVPTSGIGTVRKHGKIIRNGNGNTDGNAGHKRACRIRVPFRSLFRHHPNVGRSKQP